MLSLDDLDKLAFISKHPIDKIVQSDEVTITNSGSAAGYQLANIVTDTENNQYGRKTFVRARWSVDNGVNWQSLDSKLIYEFTVTPPGIVLFGLQGAISIGTDDTTVYFRTASGYHGNVTGGGSTWTPISQDFLIQYVLFERE